MTEIRLKSGTSFRTEISIGNHQLIADEPVSAGGTDLGPTPYDFLASALGACTAMTLKFYAAREKYPLEGTEITVSHKRMHVRDCEDCITENAFIHRFEVGIRLEGNLSHEQRTKLLEIAKRCPVYKTLTAEIKIEERLVE